MGIVVGRCVDNNNKQNGLPLALTAWIQGDTRVFRVDGAALKGVFQNMEPMSNRAGA